jgi:hypothetical protein
MLELGPSLVPHRIEAPIRAEPAKTGQVERGMAFAIADMTAGAGLSHEDGA